MGYYAKRMWGGASSIIQDSSLKLWLDASNPLSYPGTGTRWSDLSGNGNNGTMVNGVVPLSNSMQFDGVNDYAIGFLNKTIMGSQFTISFYLRPYNSNNTIGVMQIANALSAWTPWILCQRNTQTTISWYINASYRITQNVAVDEKCLITISFDGTLWQTYKNGVSTGSYVGPIGSNSGNNLYIGNGFNGYFKGEQNDYLIYNRALTAEEVNINFQATRNKYGI